MGEIKVINADLSTVNDICDFMQPVYAQSYPNQSGISREMFEGSVFGDHLRSYIEDRVNSKNAELFVSYIGDKAVGSIGIDFDPESPDSGEIWGFYVATDLQSQGIGRFLWNDLMIRPEVEQLKTLKLVVTKNLFKAISFYEGEGFFVSGEETWNWPSWTNPKGQNDYWVMER